PCGGWMRVARFGIEREDTHSLKRRQICEERVGYELGKILRRFALLREDRDEQRGLVSGGEELDFGKTFREGMLLLKKPIEGTDGALQDGSGDGAMGDRKVAMGGGFPVTECRFRDVKADAVAVVPRIGREDADLAGDYDVRAF